MKFKEIIFKIEKRAPLSISERMIAEGEYDNSGLLIGSAESEISGVVYAVDVSDDAIDLALEKNCNAIITHHPFIYAPISSATVNDYKGRLILRLIQNGISVYSSHLCMDTTYGGIDDEFAKMCGIKVEKICHNHDGYSYGKMGKIEEKSLIDYVEQLRKTFSYVHYSGDKNKKIASAASFCGQGTTDKTIKFAIDNKVDAYLSCDLRHHEIVELRENNIAVIVFAHGESEYKAFKKIVADIDVGVPTYFSEQDFRLE